MQLSQAISLIEHTVAKQNDTWADLGCGDGLFTNALSQLLKDESLIYAVDKNRRALNNVTVKTGILLKKLVLDFIKDDLPLKNLSGILMANSFHFVKDKNTFMLKAFRCLKENGYFIIVEYNTDRSNLWVPYPVSFNNLNRFFAQYNFTTVKLYEVASRYRGSIYSALASKAL